MSFTTIVEAFDTVLNVQIMNLLNLFQEDSTITKDVSYTTTIETLNHSEIDWSLKMKQVKVALKPLLNPLKIDEFLTATPEAAKKMLRTAQSLPPRLLQVVLLLRLRQGIQDSVSDAQLKIKTRSTIHKKVVILQERTDAISLLIKNEDIDTEAADAKRDELSRATETLKKEMVVGGIEESLKKSLLGRLGKMQECYLIDVPNAQRNDDFYNFLNSSIELLDQSFKILSEHHAVRPIFLDIDRSDETSFVALSRQALFLYLLLAQLPDWTLKEIRSGEEKKISSVQLVAEKAQWRKALQKPDMAQSKILAALGIFSQIYDLFSNSDQNQKFSTQIAKSIIEACIAFAKATHSFTFSEQRLEKLLGVLYRACDDQFSIGKIELIHRPNSSVVGGLWDFGGKIFGAMMGFKPTATSSSAAKHKDSSSDEEPEQEEQTSSQTMVGAQESEQEASPPAVAFNERREWLNSPSRLERGAESQLHDAQKSGSEQGRSRQNSVSSQ